MAIRHSDWLWLAPNLTCSWVNVLCSRHWHMTWTWCGQANGTCDVLCKTDARLRLLGLGRLGGIRLALFQLLCYALQYSTGKGTVNVVLSVMIGLALHLTGGRHRKDFLEKYFFGRIAFYEHGGKTGRAMIKYPPYKKNNSRKITLVYPGWQACRLTQKNLLRSCYILVW